MARNRKWFVLGLALVAAGLLLFARFWAISGTDTPTGQSGVLSILDWGTFFVSPILVFAGASLAAWTALSGRHHRKPAPSSDQIREQMRILESTH